MNTYKLGATQQKILLLIIGFAVLGLSRSPKQYFRALHEIKKELGKINRRNLNRAIKRLSEIKLVEECKMPDGSLSLKLTKEGEFSAKKLRIYQNALECRRPKHWDGKWRIVIFDIPENSKAFRQILRDHLYALDFYKLQRSVFISPYPFENQVIQLAKLYSASQYIRVITAIRIDNEMLIRKHFFIHKNDALSR